MTMCVCMGYLSIYFTLHWHYSSFVVVINWIRFISFRLNEFRFGLLLMFLARPEHTLCIWCVCGCSGVCPAEGPFFLLTCSKDFAYLNILNIKGQPPRISISLTFRLTIFFGKLMLFAQLNLHHLSWQRPVNGVPGGGKWFESLSREHSPSNLGKNQLASGEFRLSAYLKTEPSVIHWILQAIKKGTQSSTNGIKLVLVYINIFLIVKSEITFAIGTIPLPSTIRLV